MQWPFLVASFSLHLFSSFNVELIWHCWSVQNEVITLCPFLGLFTILVCDLACISLTCKSVSWPCFHLQPQRWARPSWSHLCCDSCSCFMQERRTVTDQKLAKEYIPQAQPLGQWFIVICFIMCWILSWQILAQFSPLWVYTSLVQAGRTAEQLNWALQPGAQFWNAFFSPLSLFASASLHGAVFCCATQADKCPQLSVFTKLLKGEISLFLPEKKQSFFLFFFPL